MDPASNMTASLRDLYKQLNDSGYPVMPLGFLAVSTKGRFFCDFATTTRCQAMINVPNLSEGWGTFSMCNGLVSAKGFPTVFSAITRWCLDATGC